MTLIMPQIGGFYAGASGLTVELNESDKFDISNLSTYTISVDAGAGGLVVLVFAGREGNGSNEVNLTSVTIDGITAGHLFSPCTTGNNSWVGMAYASGVSSGIVTAVVTLSDTAQECRWATYTIKGATSSTPFGTDVATGGPADSASVSINIPDSGCQIAVCQWSFSEAGGNIAWTNATEDWDLGGQNLQMSSASDAGMAAETGRVITAAASSGTPGEEVDFYGVIAASWG